MSPVVMLHRVTTVWRRSQAIRKILHVAVWMLALLCTVATAAALWTVEDTPGSTGEACLEYQDPETLDLEKKYVHPALDEGCAVCHIDCSEVSPAMDPESIPDYFLKEKEPGLCLQCHSELHPDLEAAHDGEPLGNSRCTGCHDAHASNIDKRLPEFSHGPYDARLCSDCHADPVDGEVRLVAENINALCYGCHEEVQMRIEGAQSSHKLLSESDRSCVECHDPHAANQETVLIEPVYELCIGCHGEKPEKPSIPSPQEVMQSERLEELNTEDGGYIDLSLEHVHAPVRKSCTLCHDAHASEFTAELHAPVYELCMECHGENAEIILNSDQPFPFLNGLVSLPPKSYEELPYLDLNEEFVHDPVLKSCVYCHNAHSSQNQDELYAPVNNLCLACHNDSNAERILKSSRPFPLFGGKVLLPPNTFEKMSELHLAKGGSVGHPMQNHPVYIPATDEEPEFNCLTCHISHAASTGLRRWKDEDRNNLCFECHKM